MFRKFSTEKKYLRILAAVLAATVILSESGMALAAEQSSRAAIRDGWSKMAEDDGSVSENEPAVYAIEAQEPEEELVEMSGSGAEMSGSGRAAVSQNGVSSEDESAAGSDDDDNFDEDEEREFVEYDEDAIAEEIGEAEVDPSVFRAAPVLVSGKPAVKLSWKVKGGKEYTIDRIDADGSVEHLEVRVTKKSCVDKEVWDEPENTAIYRLRATTREGEMLEYVTIPSATIMDGKTGSEEDTIDIIFARSHGPFKYVVERSEDTDFDSVTGFDVYDDSVTDDEGDGIMGRSGSLYGRPSIAFTDSDSDIQDSSTHYYRVTAQITLDGLEHINSAVSKTKKVVENYYPAPIIDSIQNDDEDHRLCYKHGYFSIYFPNTDTDDEGAKLVIERAAGTSKKYKTIKSILIEDLETYENDDGIEMYKIEYDKFYPETTYYYRAKLVVGKKNGAYSQPLEKTCHFAPIEIVDGGEKTSASVFLTWLSDECATKYYIYRSRDTWDNKADAVREASKYPRSRFAKIATVKNKTLRSEDEITYTDKKGQQIGVYHAYRIVPANKRTASFTYCDDDNFAVCKAYPDSPRTLEFESAGLSRMVIKWNKVSGAVAYRIDRTDCLDVDGEPVWEDTDGVEYKSWEFGKDDYYSRSEGGGFKQYKPFTETKLDQFVGDGEYDIEECKQYYYRVLAAVKVNGVVMWTTDVDSYLPAVTQPKTVKNMNVFLGGNTTIEHNYPAIKFSLDDDWEDVDGIQIGFSSKRGDRLKQYEKHLYKVELKDTSRDYSVGIADKSIQRGSRYYIAVRTLHEDADGEIVYGKWVEQKFVLPTEILVFPEGHDENYKTSSSEPFVVDAGSKKTIFIKYLPEDTTYFDMNVDKYGYVPVLSSSNYFTVTKKTYPSKSHKGWYYFTVEAKSSSSYYSGSANVTVTAKNYDKQGDSSSMLSKKVYLSYRRSTSSSMRRSTSIRRTSSRRYY